MVRLQRASPVLLHGYRIPLLFRVEGMKNTSPIDCRVKEYRSYPIEEIQNISPILLLGYRIPLLICSRVREYQIPLEFCCRVREYLFYSVTRKENTYLVLLQG
jgi:hypothetical protein